MKPFDSFSVQPVNANGQPNKAICFHVEARSPIPEAELVLGETLATQGPVTRLRALVWKLVEDYTSVRIPLFAPNGPASGFR